MASIARATSPQAVDLLLAQPVRWRQRPRLSEQDHARSRRLNRLLTPPLVVLAGPANVGKSTLSNALIGRSISIAADTPGTTRDYTSGRIELAGLVVDWHDTPGLRPGADVIERSAQRLARGLLQRADLVIAMTDADHDWPQLPRPANLRVAGKCDIATRPGADVALSAADGTGIGEFVGLLRERLVPAEDLEHPGPWMFDERLD